MVFKFYAGGKGWAARGEKAAGMESGRGVVVEIAVEAPRAKVWEAWTDPARLQQWLADRVSGRGEEGGRLTWTLPGHSDAAAWTVAACDAGERLALRDAEGGTLEVALSASGDETVVALQESGRFPATALGSERFEAVEAEWDLALSILKRYVERYFGQDRAAFQATAPAAYPFEKMLPYLMEADLLARWLTRGAGSGVGFPGTPAAMTLRDGTALSGMVLNVTPRGVAVSWEEVHGVLVLEMGRAGTGGRAVAARGHGWGLAAERARAIEAGLQASLTTLKGALACAPLGSGFF